MAAEAVTPQWRHADAQREDLMKPTPATRKSFADLTALDLETFPMWEYCLDEESDFDESFVRPVVRSTLPDGGDVFVAVDVETGNGKKALGVVTASDGALTDDIASLFIDGERHLFAASAYVHLAEQLDTDVDGLFPLTLRARVRREGEDEPETFVLEY